MSNVPAMSSRFRVAAVLFAGLFLIGLPAAPAAAHDERTPIYPDGTYHVPQYRTGGPTLLVCKSDRADFEQRIAAFPDVLKTANRALWGQCQSTGYRHLQAAVNAATVAGTTIKVLPGLYQEEPTAGEPTGACASLDAPTSAIYGYQVLTFEQQLACPNNQQLVAVLNKRDMQIEGTGYKPTDVIIDAGFKKLNGIRADRSNGFYIKNLTVQRTTFNAIYIMETDGFVIDNTVGRWTDEYGYLTFADDHGLYKNCEAYGNGDSGIYPGAASNINAGKGFEVPRYAIEITNCYSHDNTLGYSGTAGDSVWAHDNRFVHNGTGVSTDSAFPNHPGMPQNHAKFENNEIGDNNQFYYGYVRDGTCAKPPAERGYETGVVCPSVGIPTGTGVLNPGGNYNIWTNNWIYGNDYAGFLTTWVPGFVRSDNKWSAQWDTSHHDRYLNNKMGVTPTGEARPNRLDYWWDGEGTDNCWTATSGPTEPMAMPECGAGWTGAALGGPVRRTGEPIKVVKLLACNRYDLQSASIPDNCDWFGASGFERIEIQVAGGEAALVGMALLLIYWRRLRTWRIAAVGTGLGIIGLAVGVYGTSAEGSRWTGIGLLLLGAGWLLSGIGLRQSGKLIGRRGLGTLTIAIGLVTLVGGVDRGFYMLPYTPLSPTWYRILLELVWVPWALLAALRGNRSKPPVPKPEPPAPADEPVAVAAGAGGTSGTAGAFGGPGTPGLGEEAGLPVTTSTTPGPDIVESQGRFSIPSYIGDQADPERGRD
jgi:hypothetical protein